MMNRLSAILGLFAIAAVTALIGARAQVIDWVPFGPAPSEFPKRGLQNNCATQLRRDRAESEPVRPRSRCAHRRSQRRRVPARP